MPEATVDEDNCAMSPEDDVWGARQRGIVKPIAKTLGVEITTNVELGLVVLGSDAAHHPASDGGADDVGHGHIVAAASSFSSAETSSR